MHSQIVKRAGAGLLAIGIIDGAVTIARLAVAGPYPGVLDGIAVIAGIALLRGGPRAALWVRTLAVFLLAAGVVLVIAAPLYQPLDLTLTEIRLDPGDFATKAASVTVVLCVTLWVTLRLGQRSIQDAISRAGIRRWDMRMPAQAGGGIVALSGCLLWLTLHGQSADLATSLALQQLGPDYRYHLSWISSANNGHGRSVTGVVTAWNDKEIRTVLLHWETR
jgi:hypothetical protein